MKRWNGWGEESVQYDLPESAHAMLESYFGELTAPLDTKYESILNSVPHSRLRERSGITIEAADRFSHARGQSFPDWIALRHGSISVFPDAVAYPEKPTDVQELITLASKENIRLIPYGGGTSVVGHINVLGGASPVLTVDMGRMDHLLDLDKTSGLARFQTGVSGPEVEKQLNNQGWTLGHYPQSFEFSTLGGWIATRSSGQQSYYYGRIEDLFAGGKVETSAGTLNLPVHPASGAGPDLKHMILGSEGRMGIITESVVRVQPLPEIEQFFGVLFKDWEGGMTAVREAAQSGVTFSMMRFSDPTETELNFQLSGKSKAIFVKNKFLPHLGYGEGACLLLLGITGQARQVQQTRQQVRAFFRRYGGSPFFKFIGRSWYRNRFRLPYIRNTLWDVGIGLDTLETAVSWNLVPETAARLKSAISSAMETVNEKVLVFAHLSHVYPEGASVYITFLFRRCDDPEELHNRWKAMKHTASEVIVELGGTISHQHGVGTDHMPYLAAEKGELGLDVIRKVKETFDPQNIFNPGKLVE